MNTLMCNVLAPYSEQYFQLSNCHFDTKHTPKFKGFKHTIRSINDARDISLMQFSNGLVRAL